MLSKIALIILTVSLLAGFGCGGDDGSESGGQKNPAVPTTNQIANLTYSGVFDSPVTLSRGRYEGTPFAPESASRPTLEWAASLFALGDLTGDGDDDAAVLLVESSGGSGTRLYLAVVTIRDGEPVNVGTVLIGDRPQVRSLKIADANIWMDLVEQGPDDAACCPTQLARKAWRLQNDTLTESASQIEGTLSIEMLLGTEWVLTHTNIGEPAPPEAEITMEFLEGKITGSSGCNNYFAIIEETSPGNVRMGPLASTRKACPEELEQIEYFHRLRASRVKTYWFFLGRLALSWRSPDGWNGTMLFVPRPPTPAAP
ncbi:MAG: META domain-containing protein [Candidatus Latescibacterota bacterium]|nr:MAG: META domain-containing protein [Candidatus Latescibacterota bacterium]